MAQTGWCWSRKFIVTIQLRDLTNVQFSIPNVHPMGRRLRILCRLLSPRMRIEHWELSIGQILCPRYYARLFISDFGFEMQDLSNFEISSYGYSRDCVHSVPDLSYCSRSCLRLSRWVQ